LNRDRHSSDPVQVKYSIGIIHKSGAIRCEYGIIIILCRTGWRYHWSQDHGNLCDTQPVAQQMELGLGNLYIHCAFCRNPIRKTRFLIS